MVFTTLADKWKVNKRSHCRLWSTHVFESFLFLLECACLLSRQFLALLSIVISFILSYHFRKQTACSHPPILSAISLVAITLVWTCCRYLCCLCFIILVIEMTNKQRLHDDSIYDALLASSDSDVGNYFTQLFDNLVVSNIDDSNESNQIIWH